MMTQTELPPELEEAVRQLLKPPHLYYLRELRSAMEKDPMYLLNNEYEVSSHVQEILTSNGVKLKPDEMRLHWQRVLGIAFHRIQGQ